VIASSTPPSAASCERCGGAGWLSPGPTLGRGPIALIPCGCAATARQRGPRLARLGDELGELKDRTLDSFRLDRQLEPITWEKKSTSVAAQRNFLTAAYRCALAYAAQPRGWLYLHGAFGAGKSHLAAAIANAVVGAGRSAQFFPVGKLLDRLTAALRDGTADTLLDTLIACDLLVLDELARAHLAEAASDYRFGRIERLVNERLDKPTIITASVAPFDLAVPGDLRAERIADRIGGAASIIWLPISSYRRLGKEVVS
jgi:DNA replication protein DnaC